MADTKITPADVEKILKLVESAEQLSDFHLKYGDFEIHVSRAPGPTDGATTQAPLQSPAASPLAEAADSSQWKAAAGSERSDPVAPGMAVVKAPMVGTLYRAPSPGAKSFVEIGDLVQADTVVCIIEVMKLMNSIHAGVAGTVREIRVENSQPVEFGQVLMVIDPDR